MNQISRNNPAPALSVVVPMHNERACAAPLLDEIGAALEGVIDYEMIVVDDASVDGTGELLDEEMDRRARLRVIHRGERRGQSAAVTLGVRNARAPWVATLDGDGQNDPADIVTLLNHRDAQGDARIRLFNGHRVNRRDTWLKRVSSKVANRARSALLRDSTPDTGCGLKLFHRESFLMVPHFDHLHRFLPALFLRSGFGVRSVPVSHRPRERGVSKYGLHNRLWVGIVDTIGVAWLQRRSLEGPWSERQRRTSAPGVAGSVEAKPADERIGVGT
ncbi:MAG: glycosyltransferase family 2 protein [Phycisphaeraceae bacterium]|nr:glycosyltransferase family 2 protein [Phycisphaeraceae bacterium]